MIAVALRELRLELADGEKLVSNSPIGRQQAAWSCTTLALAALLNGTGCLRFAYNEVERKAGSGVDAGMDAGASQNQADASAHMDAQLPAAGGSAGVGGSSDGGRSATAAGSGGSKQDADAGAVDASADAAVASDAGVLDAAMAAAGSGGSNSAGAGSGGTIAGGSGGAAALPFDNCMQGTGVLFCNGFEESLPWTPTPWGYEKVTAGSTEQRSTSWKYAGAASAHMSTTQNARSTAARVAFSGLGGLKSGEIWLRYYYYLPRTVTIDTYFSAGVMSELAQPYAGFSLLIYPDSVQVESALLPSNALTTYTFPRNQWLCVEHHVVVDASAGYFEIYVDRGLVIRTVDINSIPDTGWSSAEVGIHYVGNSQGPVDVYVDNVVVSTERYGCD